MHDRRETRFRVTRKSLQFEKFCLYKENGSVIQGSVGLFRKHNKLSIRRSICIAQYAMSLVDDKVDEFLDLHWQHGQNASLFRYARKFNFSANCG